MSQYLVLIYADEAGWAGANEATSGKMMGEYVEFGEKNAAAIVAGDALQPTSTATSIRGWGTGEFAVTDGAFAETKEALGGYYLIEAEDLDAAIEIAKQVPAPWGGVELRPVRVFES